MNKPKTTYIAQNIDLLTNLTWNELETIYYLRAPSLKDYSNNLPELKAVQLEPKNDQSIEKQLATAEFEINDDTEEALGFDENAKISLPTASPLSLKASVNLEQPPVLKSGQEKSSPSLSTPAQLTSPVVPISPSENQQSASQELSPVFKKPIEDSKPRIETFGVHNDPKPTTAMFGVDNDSKPNTEAINSVDDNAKPKSETFNADNTSINNKFPLNINLTLQKHMPSSNSSSPFAKLKSNNPSIPPQIPIAPQPPKEILEDHADIDSAWFIGPEQKDKIVDNKIEEKKEEQKKEQLKNIEIQPKPKLTAKDTIEKLPASNKISVTQKSINNIPIPPQTLDLNEKPPINQLSVEIRATQSQELSSLDNAIDDAFGRMLNTQKKKDTSNNLAPKLLPYANAIEEIAAQTEAFSPIEESMAKTESLDSIEESVAKTESLDSIEESVAKTESLDSIEESVDKTESFNSLEKPIAITEMPDPPAENLDFGTAIPAFDFSPAAETEPPLNIFENTEIFAFDTNDESQLSETTNADFESNKESSDNTPIASPSESSLPDPISENLPNNEFKPLPGTDTYISKDELRDLIQNHIKNASAQNADLGPGQSIGSGKEYEVFLNNPGRSKFIGGKVAESANTPQKPSPFKPRIVPADIRKSCLILGLRPENISYETVQNAWKKSIALPGVHPDQGGDTEMAVYLNTAKDVLVRWLDAQAPKLGKKFGGHNKKEDTK